MVDIRFGALLTSLVMNALSFTTGNGGDPISILFILPGISGDGPIHVASMAASSLYLNEWSAEDYPSYNRHHLITIDEGCGQNKASKMILPTFSES